MNVALRLLMRPSGPPAPFPPLRSTTGRLGLASGARTVNFVEATPLDSTHLLVAVVTWSDTDTLTVPGWTEVDAITTGSAARGHLYARQGDGSANGITLTGSGSNIVSVHLMAFQGFVSVTPLVQASSTDSSGTYNFPALPSTPSGDGVVVAAMACTNSVSSWGTFTNGYDYPADTPATSLTARAGLKTYIGSGGSYGTDCTASGGSAALFHAVFPLA